MGAAFIQLSRRAGVCDRAIADQASALQNDSPRLLRHRQVMSRLPASRLAELTVVAPRNERSAQPPFPALRPQAYLRDAA